MKKTRWKTGQTGQITLKNEEKIAANALPSFFLAVSSPHDIHKSPCPETRTMKNNIASLLLLVCSLICSPHTLHAQEAFSQLSVQTGLAHSDANSVVQDADGLIWIGTLAGLQSYDGYELKAYDYYPKGQKVFESHNRIMSMTVAADRLWIGSESGLTCFHQPTRRYVPIHFMGEAPSDIQEVAANSKGTLLAVGTTRGSFFYEIRHDTLRELKWSHAALQSACRRLHDFQFDNDCVLAISGHEVVRLLATGGMLRSKGQWAANSLLPPHERLTAMRYTAGHLYLRTQKAFYRFPLKATDTMPRIDQRKQADLSALLPEHADLAGNHFVVTPSDELWGAFAQGLFKVEHPFSGSPRLRTYLNEGRIDPFAKLKVNSLIIDTFNNLWVATGSRGVFHHNLTPSKFSNLGEQDFHRKGMDHCEIISITGQPDGTVWFIAEYARLFRFSPRSGNFNAVALPFTKLAGFYLQNVEASRDGIHLYLGTSNGVFIYHTQTGAMRKLSVPPGHIASNASISDLQEDRFGRLWMGIWGEGLICLRNPLGDAVTDFLFSTESTPELASNYILQVKLYGTFVYASTTKGLHRIRLNLDGSIGNTSTYKVKEDISNGSLSSNYIASIDCVNDSLCWVGTIGGGLCRMVIHSDSDNDYTALTYTTENGLTTNDCEIVMTDKQGNVWIGGSNDICRLDAKKGIIETYGVADGLTDNAYKVNVSYKANDETFYMGGLYGLSYFHPQVLMPMKRAHRLMWTALFVNNHRVAPLQPMGENKHVILGETIDRVSGIRLHHDENNFALSFAALGYEQSEQVMYRCRLKGFQTGWQHLNHASHQVYYSDLPYGDYLLELQLSTDKGYTWQAGKRELKVSILPPIWWSTPAKWAYLLLSLLAISTLYKRYAKVKKLRKENESQKRMLAEEDARYQAKMQFFVNASHELKTPLTLMLLAAESLPEGPKGEAMEKDLTGRARHTIIRNVKRMLALIAELIDIHKHDLKLTQLDLQRVDFNALTTHLAEEMKLWATQKEISLCFSPAADNIVLYADTGRMAKMLLNLFSNAIKYTEPHGTVEISLQRGMVADVRPYYPSVHTEGSIEPATPICLLRVKDTGVGISPESIHRIYERFFQVSGSSDRHLGSGIGLAIVKNVVLEHKGQIVVSSKRNVGTEFIVALPLEAKAEDSAGTPPAPICGLDEFIAELYMEHQPIDNTTLPSQPSMATQQEPLRTLLIVEDNAELQRMLREQLSDAYHIISAENGREGLELCLEHFPDLILSDVMMPEMDGIEMCRRLKNNLSTAVIPLIMLTAKENLESQLEGYESGADLYLPKPFSLKLLKVNIERLLKQREQWMANYCPNNPTKEENLTDKTEEELSYMEAELSPSALEEKTDTSHTMPNEEENEDSGLQRKLKELIEEQMADPELSPEKIASALCLSRSKLYRSCNRIDGLSLADYVKKARLDKAAYLFKNTSMNISEVMFEVGLVNNSHFTKIFKQRFGITPSEFKRKDFSIP